MKKKLLRIVLLMAVLLVNAQAFAFDFEVNGIYYNTLDATSHRVEVTNGDKTYTGSVNIPSTVTYNGTEYTVTKIGDGAFTKPEWKTIGKCRFTEDMVTTFFTIDPETYELYIQEHAETPGYYRVLNPYGPAFPYYTSGSYDNSTHYMYIDATNPNQVFIPEFRSGLDFGYGEISVMSTAYYYKENGNNESAAQYYGELKDGVISFPVQGMLVSMANYNGGAYYYSNRNGQFKVVLPNATSQSVKAESKKAVSKTVKLREDINTLMPIAFINKPTSENLKQRKSFKRILDDENTAQIGEMKLLSVNKSYVKESSLSNPDLTAVTIPNTVTAIGEGAFKGCSGLTEITIPASVEEIDYYAFRNCTGLKVVNFNAERCYYMGYNQYDKLCPVFWECSNISTINIGENVKNIPNAAFYGCTGVTEITIPESVESMGMCSFASCSSLSVVNMNSSLKRQTGDIDTNPFFRDCDSLATLNIGENVEYVSSYLCKGCTGLSTINFSSSVKEIGYYAFYGCTSLTSVDIPNTVTAIGVGAFEGCTGLTSFYMPASVTGFSGRALDGCTSMTEINVDPENKEFMSIDGVLYTKDKSYIVKYPVGRTDTEYTIDSNTKIINSYAFTGNEHLANIVIPDGVKEIYYQAFSDCVNINQFSLPKSIELLYRDAFHNTGWYNNQPDGVLYIDDLCVGHKGGVTGTLSIKEGTRVVACEAFFEQELITEVIIPNSVTSIGHYAFYGCKGLTEVTVPNSVTFLGKGVFFENSNLEKVQLPESLTEIPDGLLLSTAIKEIAIPASVKRIGQAAFQNCLNLTNVEVPNTVTEIDEYAFSLCSNLISITLPKTLTEIDIALLWGCYNLASITIPESVNEIKDYAFDSCWRLKSVKSLNPIPPVCVAGAFNGAYEARLEVPAGSKDAYMTATEWSNFANVVEAAKVEISTQEDCATFEIPVTEGAVAYTVNVYADEAMTVLVATTHYDADGNIVSKSPRQSTTLALSIDGLNDGTYYYEVLVKSESGETLNNYVGLFDIDSVTGIDEIMTEDAVEVARYDAGGKLLAAPVKGLNIVKYSNGAVKKVIVK